MLVYSKFVFRETCSVYEIYPQSETPRLTQIAHLDFDPPSMTYLLPGTVIWFDCYMDRWVFGVWDYRLNHSISFSVVENLEDFEPEVYSFIHKALKLASIYSFVGR